MEDLEVIDVEDVISVDNSFTDEVSVDELFTEDINVEDTIEDIVETEINVVEELLVDDDVYVSDAIIDDLPNIIEAGQFYIYVPIASANNKGIAEFNSEHFTVIDGVVYIKFAPKAKADKNNEDIVDTYQRKDNMINRWITDLLDSQYPSAKLIKSTLDKISYDKGKAIFVFNTKEDFINWLDGKLETDINGKTIIDLAVGDDVFVLDLPANYWCKKLSNPLTVDDFVSYTDLSALEGLKSEWGNIEGDINNQTDLMELVNNIKDKIPDVSNFITRVVDDLVNYYTKSETYTKDEVDEKVSAIPKFSIEAVDTLPTTNISSTTVYLLKISSTDTDNLYQEYIYVKDTWELLGTQKVDLTNYVTKTELENKRYATKLEVNSKVSLSGDEEIRGVKTFMDAPEIFRSQNDTAFSGNQVVPARFVEARLAEEKLIPGNNTIQIEGNKITANLEGMASIIMLESPVTIWELASGVYQLPAGCKLYYSQNVIEQEQEAGFDLNIPYINEAPATLVVQTTENRATQKNTKKLFVLFAEIIHGLTSEIGESGSFIVGQASETGGKYHIAGTDIAYVPREGNSQIYGVKSFQNKAEYGTTVSLDTSLNDRTLVDAKWVKAQGYLGSNALNDYVTETELAAKGYLTSAPVSSVNGKTGAVNLTARDTGALSDYTLTIHHQSAGNPRMVKFASVNYATSATCFKMSAMTCHDNGVSYQFLTDMLIAVTTAGQVTSNIYKFAQSSVGNVDGVARYTGDVFYVNDTTNKIVDFYILCGQYSSSQFTPVTKVGSTTIAYVTQYTGNATYYSSGTKVWVSGCGSTYTITMVGVNAPTPSTVGATGQFYYASDYDDTYICVGTFSDGTYNWKYVGGASSPNKQAIVDLIHPVYSFFFTTVRPDNFDPADKFGGQWELIEGGRALWTAQSNGLAATYLDAGLPNITGTFWAYCYGDGGGSGAFASGTSNGNTLRSGSTGGYNFDWYDFNANRSNGIYGASTTVQPPAYTIFVWHRIG